MSPRTRSPRAPVPSPAPDAPDRSPYSPFKAVHHPDRLATLRAGGQPAPVQVQIVLSDLCNQDCHFCAYRMSGYPSNRLFAERDPATGRVERNPRRRIPFEKAWEILDDCAEMGVRAIDFTGGGEPTVHPRHPELFRRTVELGLDLALLTNGVLLREEAIPALAQARFVRFSIDAGSAETYARVHRTAPAHFAKVLANVERVAATRRGRSEPLVGVNFVATPGNWREAPLAARRARDAGADYLRIAPMRSVAGPAVYEPFASALAERRAEARALAGPAFRVLDHFDARLEDPAPDYDRCGHMHLNTFIGGDLNVYRCCTQAYNERGLVGSLRRRRFRELWESDAKRADFARFDPRGCASCPMNEKNRFLAYATDPDPLHVNFV